MENTLSNSKINIKSGSQFHYEYIIQNRVIKLYQDDKKIIIAKDNTVNKELINEIKFQFKTHGVEFQTVSQKEFDDLTRDLAGSNLTDDFQLSKSDYNENDLTKLASDAPVVNLVNDIILQAVDKKASDIHFEVFESYFRVRYRLNGYLQTNATYPIKLFDAVCARLKVISKLDITQRRLPQDGKAIINIYNKKIDIRTSTLPTIFGESIVLRLLGIEDDMIDLKRLGLFDEDVEILKNIIMQSYGAFILTGPTGSGKTTTLHAMLHILDSKSKNIITIEDPVEYTVEGINQVQINEKIGYTFTSILRNILRQDPDIVMVGEMRDIETADLALRSAMTGHLVLTTLHTNDAIGSIVRLINMGIERYVIESSVIACAAQRLVRTLCVKCREEYQPKKKDRDLLKRYNIAGYSLFKPKGCAHCNNTGYSGRKGIFEIFQFDEKIRELIINKESVSRIREYLFETGYVTMFEKGLRKAAEGQFFLDEVKSIVTEIK